MKRFFLLLFLILTILGIALAVESIVDSYSETNKNANYNICSNQYKYTGQTFTGNGSNLTSCKFYMSNKGCTDSCKAFLYAHSGVYGFNGIPTGSPLDSSSAIACSSIPTAFAYGLITFTFGGSVKLEAGTYYVITVRYLLGEYPTSFLLVGIDNSSPTHGGNAVLYTTDWTSSSTVDVCFYVYGESAVSGAGQVIIIGD